MVWLFDTEDNDLWKISTRESQVIWKDIRQFTIFKLLATQNVRKGKGKCAQPERGKAITKPRLKKTASLTATNAPTNPFRRLFGFSDPASLFSPAPVASPLLATASWRAGAADRGVTVPHAAGSHAATHPSRSALATAVAAGWQRAGIREGWRAPAPEDADMWAGTSAHLAVASEHLSGRPQRMRAARRGERAEEGRERLRAWPRRAERQALPASSPGPRTRPPPRPPPPARHPAARPRSRPAPRGARQPGRRRPRRVLPRARSPGRPAALSIVLRWLTRGGWPGRVGGVGLVPGRTYRSVGP